jgi:hypothetical protein
MPCSSFIRWCRDTRGDMVESALTMPILILVTLALVNLALAGFASVTANNAANLAARLGSVDQVAPGATAYAAAERALVAGVGEYTVQVTQADGFSGGRVSVSVRWSVPNFFAGLMPLFGAEAGPLAGEAVGMFRKEGW